MTSESDMEEIAVIKPGIYDEDAVSERVRKFLGKLPLLDYMQDINDRRHTALVHHTWQALFYSCSVDAKYYDLMFQSLSKMNRVDLATSWSEACSKTNAYWSHEEKSRDASHIGHICAKEITPGSPVFNCYDCGVDETCCMCEDCFDPEQHKDHNVSVHTSSGGAICDCGDEASWKYEMRCPANDKAKQSQPSEPLPEDLINSIVGTVTAVFDYFLDVQSTNIQTTKKLHEALCLKPSQAAFEDLAKNLTMSEELYGPHINTLLKSYCVVVWNDETHNWDQAIDILLNAIHRDKDYNGISPESLASLIDKFGYAKVCQKTDDWGTLLAVFRDVQLNHGLVATIVNDRDFARNTIAIQCMKWLRWMTRHLDKRICELVKYQLTVLMTTKYTLHSDADPYVRTFIDDCSLLTTNNQIPQGSAGEFRSSDLDLGAGVVGDNNGWLSLSTLHSDEAVPLDGTTRIQLLFFLEMRFAKGVRKIIKSFLIPLATSTYDLRLEFAEQIIDILPQVEIIYASQDREWALSLLESFRLQVYHDPAIGNVLAEKGKLYRVFQSAVFVLINKATANLTARYTSNAVRAFSDNSFIKHLHEAELTILKGITTICTFIRPGNSAFFDPRIITYIVLLASFYNESFWIQRKLGEHVQIENRLYKANYARADIIYDLGVHLSKIVAGFENREQKIESFIRLVEAVLVNSPGYTGFAPEADSISDIERPVSQSKVTMLLPLTSLFANLCLGYRHFDPKLLSEKTILTWNWALATFTEASEECNLYIPAYKSLRSMVVQSQIKVGFWVRNGNAVVDQAYMAEMFFTNEQNVYLIQAAIIKGDLSVQTLLDCWEFDDCINKGKAFDKSVYEDRTPVMLLEMATTLYFILTDRRCWESTLSRDQRESIDTRIFLSYYLSIKPQQYSSLEKVCGRQDGFETAFEEVSHYLPPKGLKDYGKYTLKDELYDTLDPYGCHNSSITPDEIEQALIENLARIKNKAEKDIVLKPRIWELTPDSYAVFKPVVTMMNTRPFIKYIYKALQYSVDTNTDDHVMATLHLLHAIILEATDPHALDSIIDLPICNVLLNIAENTDTPKKVSKKAATVLEVLLLKDSGILETLVNVFGEHHIEEYRKSDHGSTLETQQERTKRMARKRQEKIMAKMRGQQQAFMMKNKTTLEEMSEQETTEHGEQQDLEHEARTCILCRNPENYDELFGIPALISSSGVFWDILSNDTCLDYHLMIPDMPPRSKNSHMHRANEVKFVITGCPHGMHYSCFTDMLAEKDYEATSFNCPLCGNHCNAFIPSFRFPGNPINVCGEPTTELNSITEHLTGDNVSQLTTEVIDRRLFHVLSHTDLPAYKKIMDQLKMTAEDLDVITMDMYDPVTCSTGMSCAWVLASTMQMLEIVSRDEELEIQPITLTLLRSLVQYRILLNYLSPDDDLPPPSEVFTTRDCPLVPSEVIIMIYFESGESLETCYRFVLTNWVIAYALELMLRSLISKDSLKFDSALDSSIPDLDISSPVFKTLESLCVKNRLDGGVCPTHALVHKLYRLLASIFPRWKVQSEIFGKVLCFENNPFPESIDEVILAMGTPGTYENRAAPLLANKFIERQRRDRLSWFTNIDFPGRVHLMKLPDSLSDLSLKADTPHKGKHSDHVVCLHCGMDLDVKSRAFHSAGECALNSSSFFLFFSPAHNCIEALLGTEGRRPHVIEKLASPYLNKHGEAAGGLLGAGDAGTLDRERYKYLERCWMDQSLEVTVYRDWINKSRAPRNEAFEMFMDELGNPTLLTARAMAAAMGGELEFTRLMMDQGVGRFGPRNNSDSASDTFSEVDEDMEMDDYVAHDDNRTSTREPRYYDFRLMDEEGDPLDSEEDQEQIIAQGDAFENYMADGGGDYSDYSSDYYEESMQTDEGEDFHGEDD